VFVDWRAVNAIFCGAIWLLVAVLALVIIAHRLLPAPAIHHAVLHMAVR
jgi:hypothetical protein